MNPRRLLTRSARQEEAPYYYEGKVQPSMYQSWRMSWEIFSFVECATAWRWRWRYDTFRNGSYHGRTADFTTMIHMVCFGNAGMGPHTYMHSRPTTNNFSDSVLGPMFYFTSAPSVLRFIANRSYILLNLCNIYVFIDQQSLNTEWVANRRRCP